VEKAFLALLNTFMAELVDEKDQGFYNALGWSNLRANKA
jgi:hypothetical protein